MTDLTTVQVKELPPNPISLTDNFPHEVGDILSRATIQELVDFIQLRVTAKQYEIKYVRAPNSAYINDNFNMAIGATQGLGKAGGLWEGWAICNGNNGTDNLDGQVLIGQGVNYPTVGTFIGSKDAVLPSHTHDVIVGNVNDGKPGSSQFPKTARWDSGSGTLLQGTTTATGVSGSGKNIQPSMVILTIMKL